LNAIQNCDATIFFNHNVAKIPYLWGGCAHKISMI
jgi:hypothetical protein